MKPKKYLSWIFIILALFNINIAKGNINNINQTKLKLKNIEIPFIVNKGQINKKVSYYAKIFAGTVFITKEGKIVYFFPNSIITEKFMQGRANPIGKNLSNAKINYFIGKDKKKWKKNIESYKELYLGEVWKGIKVNLKAYGNNIEKIYTIMPKSSVNKIRMKIDKALSLKIGKNGDLIVKTKDGNIAFRKPYAYQNIKGKQKPIKVKYKLLNKNEYTFFIGKNYNPKYPIIIDPIIQSTYVGGSDDDGGYGYGKNLVITDNAVYITGTTESTDFPTTNNAMYVGRRGKKDAFVVKLTPDLKNIESATYLGGTGNDYGYAITVDKTDNAVYIIGYTTSSDFPKTSGGAQSSYIDGGYYGYDVFISKLTLDLSDLTQSTYLGGSNDEYGRAIAIKNGSIYVCGSTRSADFLNNANIIGTGAYTIKNSYFDAFIVKLDPNLSKVENYTYFGGGDDDYCNAFALTDNSVYIAGHTYSNNLPNITGGAQPNYNGDGDAYIAKFSLDLKENQQSTYIGGSGDDDFFAIDVGNNSIYAVGYTKSNDLPLNELNTRAQSDLKGSKDALIVKLDTNLSNIEKITYLGGNNEENANSIVATTDAVYVAGWTKSTDFPKTSGGAQSNFLGIKDMYYTYRDGFISKLSTDLTQIQQSTYLGGREEDDIYAIVVKGNYLYVSGDTKSSDFPSTSGGALENINKGEEPYGSPEDSFISKISSDLSGAQYTLTVNKVDKYGNGTIKSDVGNINCGNSCSGKFDKNRKVILKANASSGSKFISWGKDCSNCGSDDSCSITIDSDKTCKAVFGNSTKHNVQVNISGEGTGKVTSNLSGVNWDSSIINCDGSDDNKCSETYYEGTELTLTANPGIASKFANWSGDCSNCGTDSTCTITVNSDKNCTAIFNKNDEKYTLNLNKNGNGLVFTEDEKVKCGDNCSGEYLINETVKVIAKPDNGYTFTGWSDDCLNCVSITGWSIDWSNVCEIKMDSDKSCTANFEQLPAGEHLLYIENLGANGGIVKSGDGEINCGNDCLGTYEQGDTIELIATEEYSSAKFYKWSGDCSDCETNRSCTIKMDSDKACQAIFGEYYDSTIKLTINNNTKGKYIVKDNSGDINCGSDCEETFYYVINIYKTLRVEEVKSGSAKTVGLVFSGWGGDCKDCGNKRSCKILIDGNKTCEVNVTTQSSNKKSGGGGGCSFNPNGSNFGMLFMILALFIMKFARRKLV